MVEPVVQSGLWRRPQPAIGPDMPAPGRGCASAACASVRTVDSGPQMRRPSGEAFFDLAPPEIVAALQNAHCSFDGKSDHPAKPDRDRAPLDGPRRRQPIKLLRQSTVVDRDRAVVFRHDTAQRQARIDLGLPLQLGAHPRRHARELPGRRRRRRSTRGEQQAQHGRGRRRRLVGAHRQGAPKSCAATRGRLVAENAYAVSVAALQAAAMLRAPEREGIGPFPQPRR